MTNFEKIANEIANSYKESDITLFSSSLALTRDTAFFTGISKKNADMTEKSAESVTSKCRYRIGEGVTGFAGAGFAGAFAATRCAG